MAVLDGRGHPLRGGWSHSPPVGKGGDVIVVYSLVNFFGRNVGRDIS